MVLVGIKAGLLAYQIWRFQNSGLLDWSGLIDLEEARKTELCDYFHYLQMLKGSNRTVIVENTLIFTDKNKRTYEYLFTRSFYGQEIIWA